MTSQTSVRFGVLGPVEAVGERGPVPLKGTRQRAVLARLLVARGRLVPVDRLVGDLWAEPPEGAVAAIRTFVADLRRALEPDRPPRQPARLLVTTPPGYALAAASDAVDAWRFETAVAGAGALLAAGRPGPALAGLDAALALWRGPAYAEFADQGWARGEINRLDDLRMLAVERRAEALLALGRAAEAASDLRAHTTAQPLREDAWHLLAVALYRAGRQGDALAALRRARETLVGELGLDPGPRLRQLEADILAQAPHLRPTPVTAPVPGEPPTLAPAGAAVSTPAGGALPAAGAAAPTPTGGEASVPVSGERRPFVGRGAELAGLVRAADEVARRGRPGLALVSAEAGGGKTALAEALTERLAAAGWSTAWGRSPEYDGAPVAWPWAQVTAALTAGSSPPDPGSPATAADAGSGPDAPTGATGGPSPAGDAAAAADPAVDRFRLHRAAATRLAAAAGRRPVLVVLDDLHRADADTLDLLTALLAGPEPVTGPVFVVGTFRATEISPWLTATLARLARTEPVRVYLGGLSEAATGEVAGAVVGRELEPSTVRLLHRRSGGNPFFIRELARLLAAEGDAALAAVPAGVRDVIRHRLGQLPEATRTVLRQAAVIGRDVDPEVLAAVAGEDATLDALDRAGPAGFLTGPGTRFTHILVRDTLYGDLSAPRRARWHTEVGEAIERLRPDDVAALAHHFTQAGGRATAPRAARYATAAAERAERRRNPHEAARLWQQAVAAHDRAGGQDVRGRLGAVMGLGRALAVTGHLAQTRRLRAEAVATVERIDDPVLTGTVLAAFDVPAVWTRNDDEDLSRRVVEAAERTLAVLPAEQAEQHSRLLSTLALELRGTTTDRGRRAAAEAEAIARRLGDPALLAFALNARFMHTFRRTGLAPERARLGAELVDLAAPHQLVTFEVLGHLIGLQARCGLGDLAAADAHARAADRLAERYELPLVGVFTRWYAALRPAVDGDPAAAEVAYRAAEARLAGSGIPGMAHGLLPLALLGLRLSTGDDERPLLMAGADWGPYEPWVRPLVRLAAGRPAEAAAALRALPETPHDLLSEARLCLAARAALALDDRPRIARLYAELLPAADELAGAGSGALTLGPVARYLGELATALGRPDEAAAHQRTARRFRVPEVR
ncbi:BTAD domain-containing putative transcriptional regulator [Micromonospora sp. 4G57]|uniref:BTAD domain-containing putative transcriptional regulator n=1 Tax=Micromonospora sicca TaxID=2202420 RepID=A0ABU5JF20_9ACTN|nr:MULTISPECIES: BTAD domain-containing putative transcriptional regulator [unclassified Micromonospora]MDZ5445406.1 BTAD domain-containing putative transcriptional regulator [Micromonospora sp. 4G57]MDZ5491185.1 BTAD domain-containing putative transcriptional regulator [Micromonospora sp. 4G53]